LAEKSGQDHNSFERGEIFLQPMGTQVELKTNRSSVFSSAVAKKMFCAERERKIVNILRFSVEAGKNCTRRDVGGIYHSNAIQCIKLTILCIY